MEPRKPEIPRGLYPIVNVSHSSLSGYRAAEQVLGGGAAWLQLRAKSLSEGDFLREAARVAYLKVHNRFVLIVNHWVDVAAKVGTDGVHLTAQSMSIPEARERLGPCAIIGYSAHSLEEAQKAEAEGADYVSFGAIFATPFKSPDHPIHGLAGLRQVVDSLRIPVIAVGGIGKAEIPLLQDLGSAKPTADRSTADRSTADRSVHGFSVIRAILAAPSPSEATRNLIELWK